MFTKNGGVLAALCLTFALASAGCGNSSPCYHDGDGDGYGESDAKTGAMAVCSEGYVRLSGDCDDYNSLVNPGELEICSDGIDQDCDETNEETGTVWHPDVDGDGDGSATLSKAFCEEPPASYVRNSDDCDDFDDGVSSHTLETCDGKDNDCDGLVDESGMEWYPDVDGDGYGDKWEDLDERILSCEQPDGYADNRTDCDDHDTAINPGAAEVCGDGIDNNCDWGVDEEGCDDTSLLPRDNRWLAPAPNLMVCPA